MIESKILILVEIETTKSLSVVSHCNSFDHFKNLFIIIHLLNNIDLSNGIIHLLLYPFTQCN